MKGIGYIPQLNIILSLRVHRTVQAHWGSWANWTSCSVSCGDGIRERFRQCQDGSVGQGLCHPSSDASQQESCNEGPCPESMSGEIFITTQYKLFIIGE